MNPYGVKVTLEDLRNSPDGAIGRYFVMNVPQTGVEDAQATYVIVKEPDEQSRDFTARCVLAVPGVQPELHLSRDSSIQLPSYRYEVALRLKEVGNPLWFPNEREALLEGDQGVTVKRFCSAGPVVGRLIRPQYQYLESIYMVVAELDAPPGIAVVHLAGPLNHPTEKRLERYVWDTIALPTPAEEQFLQDTMAEQIKKLLQEG